MSTDERIRRLQDIEDIKRLKARYFRTLDLKLWDELGDVFQEDALVDYTGPGADLKGRAAVIAFIRKMVEPVRTVHHGHMPEIEVAGDTAHGVWAMFDMIERKDGTVMRGYGHYHEDYVRTAAGWKIQRLRLTRLRVDGGLQP